MINDENVNEGANKTSTYIFELNNFYFSHSSINFKIEVAQLLY